MRKTVDPNDATIFRRKHPLESKESWDNVLESRVDEFSSHDITTSDTVPRGQRRLKHHHHLKHEGEENTTSTQIYERHRERTLEKHNKLLKKLRSNPGISASSFHGMMIDAGSTGSRLHVYEFEPRVLNTLEDMEKAVAGKILTIPENKDRWTDRIKPGLGTFAAIEDDEKLQEAIYEYLSPFIDFAKAILLTKSNLYEDFPIYLKGTAGMRIISIEDRGRVIKAVRNAFYNKTFCPFAFESEQARVISGDEEAVYGWTSVNFLMGTLLSDSQGSGTVVSPKKTYGALDMGGASTQISFWSSEDLLSNLFKLQLGAAKHWNVYTRSYLYYGVNEAYNRLGAMLAHNSTEGTELHNPCLPGDGSLEYESKIRINNYNGVEYWGNTSRTFVLRNIQEGNFTQCSSLAFELLRTEKDEFCEFTFREDCSISGAYQPRLPTQNEDFGEFLAFSNFYCVWDFLGLPKRSSVKQLRDRAGEICSMTLEELTVYNNERDDPGKYESELQLYCFRASYAYQLLHNGYKFSLDDSITATNVIDNHHVGWALGSMLYEINILPWKIANIESYKKRQNEENYLTNGMKGYFVVLFMSTFLTLIYVLLKRRRQYKEVGNFGVLSARKGQLYAYTVMSEKNPLLSAQKNKSPSVA